MRSVGVDGVAAVRTTVAERVELGLLFDHSGWARSVRWSCGRPSVKPQFDFEQRTLTTDLAPRFWWLVAAGIVEPRHTFKVTAV